MKDETAPIGAESTPSPALPPPEDAESALPSTDLALAIAKSASQFAESLPDLAESAIQGYHHLLTQRDSLKLLKETADTVMEIAKILPRKGDRVSTSPSSPPLASIPVTSLDTLFGGIVKLAQNAQTLSKERTVNE